MIYKDTVTVTSEQTVHRRLAAETPGSIREGCERSVTTSAQLCTFLGNPLREYLVQEADISEAS